MERLVGVPILIAARQNMQEAAKVKPCARAQQAVAPDKRVLLAIVAWRAKLTEALIAGSCVCEKSEFEMAIRIVN